MSALAGLLVPTMVWGIVREHALTNAIAMTCGARRHDRASVSAEPIARRTTSPVAAVVAHARLVFREVREVIEVVACLHSLTADTLRTSRSRAAERARGIAMYIAWRQTHGSYPELARAFRTPHAVVATKVHEVAAASREDGALRAHIRAIEAAIVRHRVA